MNEPVTHDTFEPGKKMGEAVLALEESHAQSCQKIFGNTASSGASESAEGAGPPVTMMMCAYLAYRYG
jgi:hypothetical protein